MEQIIWKQLAFVRQLTVHAVKELSEDALNIVPEGFNNNIRWNLGHIYLVQEKFAFQFTGGKPQLPEGFESLFSKGTKPAEWSVAPPAKEELLAMLEAQPGRIESALRQRLLEPAMAPYTTGSGLTMHTIGELVNFSLYHEGMHFNTINVQKRFMDKMGKK
ncbi:DinB family protein [Paenibacillus chungangensis]|uniref:DinB family protein n=1 Tax=Paenibacillus chungangensis TaxID=696535 RepID=A0ABW3HU15_9BACL